MAKEKKEKSKLTLSDLQKKNKVEIKNFEVLSTGSLSVDRATGIGGFPKGRIVELFGNESMGKSTLFQMLAGETIKKKENAVYIDAEYGFDPVYAKTLGFDIENEYAHFVQPDGLEDTLQTAIDYANTGEVSLIVIDSLSGPAPLKETEGNIGDSNMGVKARQVSQFCRTITPILNKNNVLLCIIGQLRSNIGGYGSSETTDYGNAMKFYASMRIRVSRKVSDDKSESSTTFVFKKNKCSKPFTEGTFDLIHGEGIDKSAEIYNIGIETGVIDLTGRTATYGDIKLGTSKKDSIEMIRNNFEMADEILVKINESFKTE